MKSLTVPFREVFYVPSFVYKMIDWIKPKFEEYGCFILFKREFSSGSILWFLGILARRLFFIRCVNVYSITRHYGGSEEGGWWYDWREYADHRYTLSPFAERAKEKLLEDNKGLVWGRISSVNSGCEIRSSIDFFKGQHRSLQTPHYE